MATAMPFGSVCDVWMDRIAKAVPFRVTCGLEPPARMSSGAGYRTVKLASSITFVPAMPKCMTESAFGPPSRMASGCPSEMRSCLS